MSVTYFSAISGAFYFTPALPVSLLHILALMPAPHLNELLRTMPFTLSVFSICVAGWRYSILMWISAGDVE